MDNLVLRFVYVRVFRHDFPDNRREFWISHWQLVQTTVSCWIFGSNIAMYCLPVALASIRCIIRTHTLCLLYRKIAKYTCVYNFRFFQCQRLEPRRRIISGKPRFFFLWTGPNHWWAKNKKSHSLQIWEAVAVIRAGGDRWIAPSP